MAGFQRYAHAKSTHIKPGSYPVATEYMSKMCINADRYMNILALHVYEKKDIKSTIWEISLFAGKIDTTQMSVQYI